VAKLIKKLPLPKRRGEIIEACCQLLDHEVSRKSGLSGFAIKTGYNILKTIKPGIIPEVVSRLFDEFLSALDPFHADFEKTSAVSFGAHLKNHARFVAEALLAITDRRAEKSTSATLKSGYYRLRPLALDNVQQANPAVANLVDRFYIKNKPKSRS
jgi:hypothetical protein